MTKLKIIVRMNTPVKSKKTGLFNYLLLLTACFIFFEFSLILQYSEVYLNDFHYIADQLKIPSVIIPSILFYIFIQALIYLGFTFLVWAITRLLAVALDLSWKKTEKLGLSLWIFAISTVLLANQCLAPNSKIGMITEFIIPQALAKILLILALIVLFGLVAIAFRGLLLLLPRKTKILSGTTLFSLFTITTLYSYFSHAEPIDVASEEKPNVIIIGVDSLRPDYLGYFSYEKVSPHFDDFLNHATVFANSLTPIARTFPAWMSILTGQYPLKNGARTDLANFDEIKVQNSLSMILQKQGYQTIYATDETRFSNITRDYGFNTVISPPIGLNDFLLGSFNDFPLSNILINTSIGKYIFPYSYANRSINALYDPNSFLNLLKPTLAKSRNKPVFLAIHLCLPHYPYFWGTSVAEDTSLPNYKLALKRADQQFDDLMTLLQKNKLLEHSIVILLSDHGEAIELAGDRATNPDLFIPGKNNKKGEIKRFYPSSADTEAVNQSAGHGTDVLSLTQYHNVLAFRLYGLKKTNAASITGLVSLLDIKPTILDFLHKKSISKDDGISLKNFIIGKKTFVSSRPDFFIESDFSPQAVRSVHPETRDVIFEGIKYFQIDPKTARLSVRKSMEKIINSTKQYADFYGEWVLALYPQPNNKMTPVLVNLNDGRWTNDLTTSFAQSAPAGHMLQALKNFYGDEITQVENT